MNNTIEVWDLKEIEAASPAAFIATFENPGGGANLCGPFLTREDAELKAIEYNEDGFVYSIADAIAKFCD